MNLKNLPVKQGHVGRFGTFYFVDFKVRLASQSILS